MSKPSETQPTDADGRFANLERHRIKPFTEVLRWMVLDTVRGRRRKSPARAEVAVVRPDLAKLAVPPPEGAPARLTWLGHASWLVQLDGVSLLIDPVLGQHIFPRIPRNVGPPLKVGELPKIDSQLVSHSHYDHLDLPTLQSVGAPVISGLNSARHFKKLQCSELGWWKSQQVGAVRVTFVPAQHWSQRTAFDTNESLWGGFVIEGSRATVYHSGDTAYFSGFNEIGRRFPVDAAMLPIGAYDPEWFMTDQHMNPEQAVQSFVDLNAETFLAMHWGTFKLTDEPLEEPPIRLKSEWERRALPTERCRVLALGESVVIEKRAR